MLIQAFLFFSALAAYFVKGITGFGNTLVMGTLFSFAVSNRLTTPVDLVISIPTNAWLVWRERRNLSPRIVIPLSLLLLVGIVPGTFFLKIGNDWMLKSMLGLVIVGIAIEMWTRKPAQDNAKRLNPAVLILIGVVSGVLSGLFGIGALLVAYISRTTDSRSAFRANICCIFLIENLFRFCLYWQQGILTMEVLKTVLILSPAVVIGMLAGIRADARMDEKTVKRFIIVLLMVSGGVLFIKNGFFH